MVGVVQFFGGLVGNNRFAELGFEVFTSGAGDVATAFGDFFWVSGFFEAFAANFGEPKLERFGLFRGDGLDDAKELFGGGDVGEAVFAVFGFEFQLYDFFVRFISLFFKLAL